MSTLVGGADPAALAKSQITLALFFLGTAALWVYAEILNLKPRRKELAHDDEEGGKPKEKSEAKSTSFADNHVVKLLSFNQTAIQDTRLILRAWSELGLILLMFYLCDRTDLFPPGSKSYNRDMFIFICLGILAATGGYSTHTCKPSLLNRDQTEEWKGWMQILFLLYHYFEAREMYNAIRIFIAAYVWMTGFGNFSYYYVRQDFSLGRFCQMMWRLNFFVFFCCVALKNSYVLYYICPMHTLFTIMLYLVLRVNPKANATNMGVIVKILVCVAAVYVIWDIPGVFKTVWGPFMFLFGYTDPKKPDLDPLHEWQFRSGLDRYVWIYGMLCAYSHPRCEWILDRINSLGRTASFLAKAALAGAALAVGAVWYQKVYSLDKFGYNAVHPFTSWIPITIWVVLRNITPALRGYYIESLAWMGKITLETYISQFHVWLHSGVPDGQPGKLWVLLEGYPLVNFAVATAVYVLVSKKVFDITNVLKNACVPLQDDALIARNAATAGVLVVALLVLANVLGAVF